MELCGFKRKRESFDSPEESYCPDVPGFRFHQHVTASRLKESTVSSVDMELREGMCFEFNLLTSNDFVSHFRSKVRHKDASS
jgi:hypothetical protein